MKIIWLCNVILPEFCGEFGIKKTKVGGWLSGMLAGLSQRPGLDISLCFPIYKPEKLRDGIFKNHRYFSFLFSNGLALEKEQSLIRRFEDILINEAPDVIHIWGTEYMHAIAMAQACENLGLQNRVTVNIQGLVSICAQHYCLGIPEYYLALNGADNQIRAVQQNFAMRGENEKKLVAMVKHVSGRTEWDKACTRQMNSDITYHACGEVMRSSFYETPGQWRVDSCKRHRIFVSQGSYPIKGFHFILQALPLILQRHPDTHVYVGGEPPISQSEGAAAPYEQYIDNLLKQYDLNEKVTFLGPLTEEEMHREYVNANVFVSASTIENSSNSVCEARLVGVPVVASYAGGTPSLINHMEDGLLYQTDAPYMLAHYVCEVFEKDDLASALSKKGLERGLKINGIQKNAEDCESMYYSIATRPENQSVRLPFVSVVIPVYNHETFLPRAITSVLSQSFTNIELIIVDDGSTDGSGAVADEIAKRDERVQVIHQENQWIYAAMNTGVQAAKGKYVYILNADDELKPGALEGAAAIARQSDADVIFTPVEVIHHEKGGEVEYFGSVQTENRTYKNAEEIRKNWLEIERITPFNQANLYRTSIAKAHPFCNDYVNGDVLFNYSIADDLNRVVISSQAFYVHHLFENKNVNASHRYHGNEDEMFRVLHEMRCALLQKWDLFEEYEEELLSLHIQHLVSVFEIYYRRNPEKLPTETYLKQFFIGFLDEELCRTAKKFGRMAEIEDHVFNYSAAAIYDSQWQPSGEMAFVPGLIQCIRTMDRTSEGMKTVKQALNMPGNPYHIGEELYKRESGFAIDEGIKEKKVVLVGAGRWGEKAFNHFGPERVICFADNNKAGETFMGKDVVPVEEVARLQSEYAIVVSMKSSTMFANGIDQQLLSLGVDIFTPFQAIAGQ